MTARGESSCFLLRRDEKSWSVYDDAGKRICETSKVTTQYVAELTEEVKVDRKALEQDAREFLLNDDLSLIACAEGHSGAAAADHSNFSVLCLRMIIEASQEDLKHVFVVDSRRWSCRTVGLVADLQRVSDRMTDVYLERFRWLNYSFPLVDDHFITTFSARLARVRTKYFKDLIGNCAAVGKLNPELVPGLQYRWMSASPDDREEFARHVTKTMREGIVGRPSMAEVFSQDVVERHGSEVIRALQKMMR